MRQWTWMVVALAACALAAAPAAAQDEAVGPETAKELKAAFKAAPLVVQFDVAMAQGNTQVDPRLVWEARGDLLEVLKGTLRPGPVSVHVDSFIRAFQASRTDLAGRQYVAALAPLGPETERRFQLAAGHAYAADSPEARYLRELAETARQQGEGGQDLRLRIQPLEKVFQPTGAKAVEVRLTNTGDDSATYIQAPIAERDGKLYLPGDGQIRVRDARGNVVPDTGNVLAGVTPPPPPTPALILPKASFVETVDLAKYYDLKPGRYTLALFLASPGLEGRIPSNGLTVQVGAVDLPEDTVGMPLETLSPESPAVEPVLRARTGDGIVDLPHPSSYKPSAAVSGLAALLKPTSKVYELGEPVSVELRLLNEGPRTLALDARLEQTLALNVVPVADSPQPTFVRQVIPWPAEETRPQAMAYLREGGFWGRVIDLNMLYGRDLDKLPSPTPAEIGAGKNLSYERFGRNLYGFPKPGLYQITGTYTVKRRQADTSDGPADSAWWVGQVQTNPVLVRIVERGAAVP